MSRRKISSGVKWEDIVGYSRAVCDGPFIFIAGTTATDGEGNIVGKRDPYRQTIQIIQNIKAALQKADADLKDIVRTRIYVTNIDDWEKIGQAHGEFFREIKPATTMIEVSRLVDPDMLVEMEADAVVRNQ